MPSTNSHWTVSMKNNPMVHSLHHNLTLTFAGRLITCIAGLSLTILLISCTSHAVFDEIRPLPGRSWEQNKTMIFQVPIQDTLSPYKFYINVRHSLDYRYSNLYLFVDTHFPDGRHARDTVECRLADPSGKWYGKGITNFRYNQILLRSYLRFPKAGIYTFELEQAMREKELEGINEIGIRIEKE